MEKYLVIILLILLMFAIYQCWNLGTVTTEGFAEVATNVDTNSSIATLAQVATALQTGGLTVPGTLIAQNDIWMRKNPSESDKYAIRAGGMFNGGGITSAGGSPLELFGNNNEVFIGSPNSSAPKNNLTVTGTLTTGSARISKFYKASGPNHEGIEFLHDNGSQGIGLGFNTIYATGTLANVDLGLQAKGSGAVLISGRNILAELGQLRKDLDARTKKVVYALGAELPPGYKNSTYPGFEGSGGTLLLAIPEGDK
jgi:hypothetical protein